MKVDSPLLRPADFKTKHRTPSYIILYDKIRTLIEDGVFKPSEKLPTEKELVSSTGLSVSTIKKALATLEQEGYIYRRQGQGSFVMPTDMFLGLHRYYGMQKAFNTSLAPHEKIFVSLKKGPPTTDLCQDLNIKETDLIFYLKRIIIIGGEKRILTTSCLPCSLFNGLDTMAPSFFIQDSFYKILENSFGMNCRVSKELLSACNADKKTALLLSIPIHTPLIFSEIIAYGHRDLPFEKRYSYILSDKLRLYRTF